MLRKMMAAAALMAAGPALAQTAGESVTCHVIYGGENFTVTAQPTSDPYAVRGEKIGRYFEVKVSYVAEPADSAALSIYVYATSSGESVLIHQAKYPVDVRNATGTWGFTGFNYVYEPSKSSELQYWCEKREMARPGSAGVPGSDGLMVRIAEIEIDPAQLEAYKAILAKEQEASVRLEPGVLMLHSVTIAESPASIRLLEVYASRSAYEAHLKAPHFLEYKTSTEKMVKALRLVPAHPVLLCAKSADGAASCR